MTTNFSQMQISSLLKSAMLAVDNTIKVTGHSLRIGAASYLTSKSVNMDTIKVAGRWASDKSVLRYMRRVGLAEANLSTTLFTTGNNTH